MNRSLNFKDRLYPWDKWISSSPFMTTRGLLNNISTMRPLFFPKWPKSILIIFVSSELETDWVIFGHFLICPLVTMEAYRTNNSTDMAKNCKISFNWSLYANWNKILKKKSSNNMLINVFEWHTKLGWEMFSDFHTIFSGIW